MLVYDNEVKEMCIKNLQAKHKANRSREGVFIRDKTHVDFHKIFASIFSAYTTLLMKILS